jgi:hypothetical protein
MTGRGMHDLLDSVDVHPDRGGFERLEERRERRDRRRRTGAFALTFMLGAVAAIAVIEGMHATRTVGTRPAVPDGVVATHIAKMSSLVSMSARSGWLIEDHRLADGRVHTIRAVGPVASGGAVQVTIWDLSLVRPIDPETGQPAPAGVGVGWYRDALGGRTTVDISTTLDSSLWRWYRPYELHWLGDQPGVRTAIAQGDLRLNDVQVWALALNRRDAATIFLPDDRGSGTIPAGPSRFVLVGDRDLVLLIGVAPIDGSSIEDAWAAAWEEISTLHWRF